ncbi:MAG: hypothetical protein U0599_17805 [Vicinamibacteria bacterium]
MLAVGLLFGAVNALVVVRLRVLPFVATLSTRSSSAAGSRCGSRRRAR